MITALVIDDGRQDYLEQSLTFLAKQALDEMVVIRDADHELGFAGAVGRGWERIAGRDGYVLHWESDFVGSDLPLAGMVDLLESRSHLMQVSLKRQPVNEREKAAGGIIEADPDDFEECWDSHKGIFYVAHRRYFTTNPSIYHAQLCHRQWPQVKHSEGVFTHRLLKNPSVRFAIWGRRDEPPWVVHRGTRQGRGY